MRKEDIKKLSQPYDNSNTDIHRRFNSAIGADVPSAGQLAEEIFNDLDENDFGISWWNNLPKEERILISDYLYQCAGDIETNLVEAKLHFLEWLSAKEKSNDRIANAIYRDSTGKLDFKMPPPITPLDDLPDALKALHICGFFRAIGSILDCLGATIIGVLALPKDLRKASIDNTEKALKKIKDSGASNLQTDFLNFYEGAKKSCGVEDWLEWADQYRNTYVHRGRRTTAFNVHAREILLYDSNGQINPRAESTTHLSKYPDRTDIEAFIKSKDIWLNEDAEVTLNGIFNSCRNFVEIVSEQLLSIWQQRRINPTLLEQPQIQWEKLFKVCNFAGYDTNSQPLNSDSGRLNGILIHRMLSASVFDHQRNFWKNSKWKQ